MLLKKYKRVLALTLAGVLAVSSMGVPPLTAAAGDVSEEASSLLLQYDDSAALKDTTFDGGTNSIYRAPAEDVEKVKNISDSLELSMTFKVGETDKTFLKLFEIENSEENDTDTEDNVDGARNPATSTMMLIVNKTTGRVYLHTGAYAGSTDWQADSGQAVNDGRYHTLTMSASASGLNFKMDGQALKTVSTDSTKYTKKFVSAFFGDTTQGEAYKDWRQNIDNIIIGGSSPRSTLRHGNYGNFAGEIKSVTIKDGGYSEEALTANHRSGSAAAMTELNALLSSVGNEADYNAAKWQSYTNSAAYTTASAMSAETNAPYEIYNAIPALETAIEKLQKPVDPNAQVFDLSAQTFNGSGYSLPEADVAAFKEKVKNSSSVEISLTFSVTSASTTYINLLEISNSAKNSESAAEISTAATTPQDSIAVIMSKTGQVFLMSGAFRGSTDWVANSGVNITGGASHTLTLTVAPDGLSFSVDGGETHTVATDSSKYTKKFIQAFFGMQVAPVTVSSTQVQYTDWRDAIDTITVGGLASGSFQTASTFANLNGTVSEAAFTCKGSAADITLLYSGTAISNMFNSDPDNTWLFAGGVETQGRFAEIRGARNFVGQFEEYIRWTKATSNETLRQRYMVNVGKAGQDVVTFETKLDDYILSLKPKAVDYMIGKEDYSKGDAGIEPFKTALTSVIEKALAMKDNGGYAVIQLPHAVKDAEAAANIEKYIDAAKTVIAAVDSSKLSRVVMVDHYTQTNNDTFKNGKLTEDDLLNADGHYEIAKQLATRTEGMSGNFPTLTKWTEKAAPDTYINKTPTVAAAANSLNVTIPADVTGDSWKYMVTVNGTEISGTGTGASFAIENLPAGGAYKLIVQSADGKRQMNPVYGTVAADEQGGSAELSALQQTLAEKVNGTTPLTWLFMGDSITHAALWTNGYDGIAQSVEKYVREDLGRTDDIIINTGNSSATTTSTIANIEQRLKKYQPDIVAVMLGTNDTGSLSNEAYKTNLETIVAAIKEVNPNAFIVFRSPTPANGGAYNTKIEGGYLDAMKTVAEANGILYIDQYTDWKAELDTYSYLFGNTYYYGNYLHPGAAGQLHMAQQFITECGLNTNTQIANLSYQFSYTETQNTGKPVISATQNEISVSKSNLQELLGSGQSIGEYTVTLTDKTTNRTYTKSSGLNGEQVTIADLPTDTTYTVAVTANIAGSTAKHVTFAAQDVALSTGMSPIFQLDFDGDGYLSDTAAGTVAGTLSTGVESEEGFTYSLCSGEGDTNNDLFEIDGAEVKVKTALAAWTTYNIRVKAVSGNMSAEKALTLKTMPTLKAVRDAAAAAFDADKTAMDLDLSSVEFDGSTSVNLADSSSAYYNSGAYMQVLNNLKTSEGGSIIFRFSTTQNGTILGAGSTNADDGSNMIFGVTGEQLRGYFRIASGSGLKGNLGSGLNNGSTHTVAVSYEPAASRIRVSIDGGANLIPNLAAWQVPSWFSVNSSAITKFEIGGGGYSSVNSFGNFNGNIDFVTITDDIFTEAELQAISGGVKIRGNQELSYTDSTVTVPEGAHYTASALTWNDDKTSGTFTLTVKEGDDAVFENPQIIVANAGENGYVAETSNVTANSITVTLRKYKALLSTNVVTELGENGVVGTLSVEAAAPEGAYTYSLVDGDGSTDNAKFKIEDVDGTATLKTAAALELRQTYSIRVKAQCGENSTETVFELSTMPTLKSVRAAARADFAADQTALDVDASGFLFDGTASMNLSDNSAYMEVLNKLRTDSTGGTIIFRFKTSAKGTILGIGSEPGDNGKSMAFGLAATGSVNAIRGLFPIASGGSNLKGTFAGSGNLTDGQVHTVAMSFDTSKADFQNEALICVDGKDNCYLASWWTEAYKTWLNMLKTDITNFEIGGGNYSNKVDSSVGGFNGSIDFVTITDDVFTEAELKVISSDREEIAAPPTGISAAEATVNGDTVTIPEDTNYSVSTITWNEDKTSGTFVLTANDNYSFSSAEVTVSAAGYRVSTSGNSGKSITVTLTKIVKEILISNTRISDTAAGTVIGTLSVDGAETGESFTYALAAGTADNDKFEIDGASLKVKTALEKGTTYSVAVTATSSEGTYSNTLALKTMPTLRSARDEAAAAFDADQTGMDVDVSDVNFDGNTSVNLATLDDGAYLAVAEKLRTASTGGTIIFRFKTSANGTILGIGSEPGDNGKSMGFALADGMGKTGTLRALLPIASGGNNLKGYFGSGYADGQVHTVAMSFDTTKENYVDEVLISIDGGADIYVESWCTQAYRTWLNMLKTGITNFEIGGGSYNGKVNTGVNGFNGEIDFVTITDTVYNEAELRSISGDTTTVPRVTKVTSAQATLSQDLASVTTGADTYTGTVTWDDAKENGTITLTAAENVKFSGTTVSVTNAAALGYTAGTPTVAERTITIPLTKNAQPAQKITSAQVTLAENLASVTTGADTYTGTVTWDTAKENGTLTLTAVGNAEFEGTTVTVTNAAALGYTVGTPTVTAETVTVSLTKNVQPAQKITSAQVTLAENLASVTTGADTYTGTVTWDTAKENGTLTLTAVGNAEFEGTTVTVTNAEALGYTVGTPTVTAETVTVSLTKNVQPPQKTTVSGEQSLTISENMVTIAENAGYTASALTWNADGTSGEFTLTANENVEFGSDVTIAIANGADLGIKNVTFEVTAGSIKVTLTKEKPAPAPTETSEQKSLKDTVANLAAELTKADMYTPESFEAFKKAYQAAQKALADGETDATALTSILNALKKAHTGLVVKRETIGDNPAPAPVVIEPGKTYDAGNYRYKVLSTTDMTAEVVGLKKMDIKKVTINNSVNLGGKNYTVVSVAANAFKGNKKITSVVIKKNLKTIGKNAFAGCTKLKKVTINSKKLTTINAKAFFGCKSLKSIVIKSKVLKKVAKNVFKGIHKKATIKVPSAKLKAYTKLLAKKGQSKTVKIKK